MKGNFDFLPEPWRSLPQDRAVSMKEDQAREMFTAIHTPELDKLREDVKTMRTSELIVLIAHADQVEKRVFDDDDLDRYSRDEEYLLLAAAMLAVGDEVDRRFPRP